MDYNLKLKIDSPIFDKNGDDLNFEEIYVQSIYDVLESNQNSFSLGIIGNYGSGKTSIINLLKKKYPMDEFISVSVWGHKPIEFMRKLLIEVNRIVNKDNSKKIENELYEEKVELDHKKRFNNILILSLLLILFLILLILCVKLIRDSQSFTAFSTFLSSMVTILVFYFAVVYGVDTVSKKTITKPIAIGQFQSKFKKILESNDKDLIIVIDDLDRCLPSMVNRTLECLHCLIKQNNLNFKVKLILPFSLNKYQEDKITKMKISEENKKEMNEFKDIYPHLHKFLDSFIIIPSQSEFGLYKMFKENKE